MQSISTFFPSPSTSTTHHPFPFVPRYLQHPLLSFNTGSPFWGKAWLFRSSPENKNNGIQLLIILMKSIGAHKMRMEGGFEPSLLSSASTRLIRMETQVKQDQLQNSEISFLNGALENEVKFYDWRMATTLPIVKIYDYRIVKRDCLKTVMAVRHEHYPNRLDELKDLPLFKILYLLKEAIIGFERICDKVGPFRLTPRMVALNHQGKCKVWLNQNFASNSFIQNNLTETAFLYSICSLFLTASNKIKNTVTFFNELFQFQSFCQALAFIENYARQNKISIQNYCKIHQRELSIIENKSNSSNFDPSLTMNRSPKFLSGSNLRISLKPASKINILNLATSKMIKESEAEQCINMKTSGDTAADNFGSMLASSQASKEHVDQSIIFGSEQKQLKKDEFSFRFNKSDTKYSKFSRCLSPVQTAQSYFSPFHSKKYDEPFSPTFKTEQRLNHRDKQLQPEQQDSFLSQSVANVFNKNKWEKTIDGLFAADQNLKKSTHEGKERRKQDLSTFKLELLGSVGKNIRESIFHEDHVHPYTSQF